MLRRGRALYERDWTRNGELYSIVNADASQPSLLTAPPRNLTAQSRSGRAHAPAHNGATSVATRTQLRVALHVNLIKSVGLLALGRSGFIRLLALAGRCRNGLVPTL
jgi:hypothetical protein